MYISCAMSSGLVNILFCLSVMESRGEVSEGLKTFLFIFWGFFRTFGSILRRLLEYSVW